VPVCFFAARVSHSRPLENTAAIEECFGWVKTIGGLRKSRFVGREKLDFQFVLTFAAYHLIRMRNLRVATCC
jgi:hypothetical protein